MSFFALHSITSAQPFEGSESNLQTVYATNKETLDLLTVEMRRAKEPNIKWVDMHYTNRLFHHCVSEIQGTYSENFDCSVYSIAVLFFSK